MAKCDKWPYDTEDRPVLTIKLVIMLFGAWKEFKRILTMVIHWVSSKFFVHSALLNYIHLLLYYSFRHFYDFPGSLFIGMKTENTKTLTNNSREVMAAEGSVGTHRKHFCMETSEVLYRDTDSKRQAASMCFLLWITKHHRVSYPEKRLILFPGPGPRLQGHICRCSAGWQRLKVVKGMAWQKTESVCVYLIFCPSFLKSQQCLVMGFHSDELI